MSKSNANDLVSDLQISDALSPYGLSLDAEQLQKVRKYLSLLAKWNRLISLTSLTDPLEILGRHFGESMYATKLLPVENCRLADIGTGAGFPGLALKIASPGLQVLLIESNKKKCAFLAEVIRELNFENVEILSERFEAILPVRIQANIITVRAVGEFKPFLRWAAPALAKRGHVMLWVGADDSTRIAKFGGWTWQPPVRLPESQRRFILIGRPLDGPSGSDPYSG